MVYPKNYSEFYCGVSEKETFDTGKTTFADSSFD